MALLICTVLYTSAATWRIEVAGPSRGRAITYNQARLKRDNQRHFTRAFLKWKAQNMWPKANVWIESMSLVGIRALPRLYVEPVRIAKQQLLRHVSHD